MAMSSRARRAVSGHPCPLIGAHPCPCSPVEQQSTCPLIGSRRAAVPAHVPATALDVERVTSSTSTRRAAEYVPAHRLTSSSSTRSRARSSAHPLDGCSCPLTSSTSSTRQRRTYSAPVDVSPAHPLDGCSCPLIGSRLTRSTSEQQGTRSPVEQQGTRSRARFDVERTGARSLLTRDNNSLQ